MKKEVCDNCGCANYEMFYMSLVNGVVFSRIGFLHNDGELLGIFCSWECWYDYLYKNKNKVTIENT